MLEGFRKKEFVCTLLVVVLPFLWFAPQSLSKSRVSSIEILIQNGNLSAADKAIEKGIATRKSLANWYRLRALSYYYGGNRASLAYANRAVRINPNSIEALEAVALVSCGRGKDKASLTWAKKLSELDKENQLACAVLGHLSAEKREIVEANQCFSKIVNHKHPDFHALYMVSHDLQRTSQLKLTIKAMNKLVSSFPDSSLALIARGMFYKRTDSMLLAIKDFNKVRKLSPDNAMATLMLAKIFRAQGDYEKALPYFDEYLKVYPSVASAYTKRAECYGHLGQHDKAIADYSRAINLLVPGTGDKMINMKEYSQMRSKVKREYKICWIQRADTYAKKGKAPKAIALLTTFLKCFSKDSTARYLRYKLFLKTKMFHQALIDIDFLIKQYPDISKFHKERTLLLRQMSDNRI